MGHEVWLLKEGRIDFLPSTCKALASWYRPNIALGFCVCWSVCPPHHMCNNEVTGIRTLLTCNFSQIQTAALNISVSTMISQYI